ncbi:small acid-soluble spore protein [Heliobacterium chlorum]|uniref:Small acid-soluble spore protein n=1 Tax=Heliobacterium chlorum TaxID=2698 RepID=A0ABR7T2T3_HELCL|nr:small acid-soluble spore protein [Heliobacterium chlorum]
MSHKKGNDHLRTHRQISRLKWETAKEMGVNSPLDNSVEVGLRRDGCETNLREQMVEFAEAALQEEGDRKARLNLQDKKD